MILRSFPVHAAAAGIAVADVAAIAAVAGTAAQAEAAVTVAAAGTSLGLVYCAAFDDLASECPFRAGVARAAQQTYRAVCA